MWRALVDWGAFLEEIRDVGAAAAAARAARQEQIRVAADAARTVGWGAVLGDIRGVGATAARDAGQEQIRGEAEDAAADAEEEEEDVAQFEEEEDVAQLDVFDEDVETYDTHGGDATNRSSSSIFHEDDGAGGGGDSGGDDATDSDNSVVVHEGNNNIAHESDNLDGDGTNTTNHRVRPTSNIAYSSNITYRSRNVTVAAIVILCPAQSATIATKTTVSPGRMQLLTTSKARKTKTTVSMGRMQSLAGRRAITILSWTTRTKTTTPLASQTATPPPPPQQQQ